MSDKSQSPGFLEELRSLFSPKSIDFSHPPSLLDFYSVFIAERALVSTEIISFEKVYGKNFKPYTVYNISVKTKTHEFTLPKRYSDFLCLHQRVKKRYPRVVNEWHFPEKTLLWGNFNNDLLETRKLQFQHYLEILTDEYADSNIIEFLDFLEIQKILQANNRQKAKGAFGAFGSEEKAKNKLEPEEKPNISEGIENEKVFQFLWNLNYCTDNYIIIFTEYENYFLNNRPKLNLESIKRLLLGDKSLRGLIEVCGNISAPTEITSLHHICSKAFKFLAMLLDHEYNREAEIYLKIYKSAPVSLITSLKLGLHIRANSQKQCKSFALKLLDLYISQNLEKTSENASKVLEGNEEAVNEYEKWKLTKRFSSHSTEQFDFRRCTSATETSLNPLLYLTLDSRNVKRKNIPLTKWLPIDIKDNKHSQFSLKHLNEDNLKISACFKGKIDAIYEKLTSAKFQTIWDILLVEEIKTMSPSGSEIFIEKFKWWKDSSECKTFVFVHKRVLERSLTEKRFLKISTPSNYQPQKNEILLTMNVSFIVKQGKSRNKQLRNISKETNLTKVKMIIKDADSNTKEELRLELKGLQNRLIDNFASFKSFAEGSE